MSNASFDLENLINGNGEDGIIIQNIPGLLELPNVSISDAGDVNGDGFADVIIGAPFANANGDQSGEVYVVFGDDSPTSPITLDSLDGSNGFKITGLSPFDWFGRSFSSAGDIDGDGFDDIIIGADGADPNGSSSGQAYVLLGGESFSAVETPDITLNGVAQGDEFGGTVSEAGDFNGDGLGDFMVTARRADPNGNNSAGQVSVFFGNTDSSTISAPDLLINGVNLNSLTGLYMDSVEDINGDGIGDIIIGSTGESSQSYLIYGKSSFSSPIDLSNLGNNGITINGISWHNDVSGGGDFNGDGYGDLLLSSTRGAPTYVVYGGENLPDNVNLADIDGTNGFFIERTETNQNGVKIRRGINQGRIAGDLNNDGYADVIVGAYLASPDGKTSAGETYVVYGGQNVGATGSIDVADLDGENGLTIKGINAGDQSGVQVSRVGDFNGDGGDDVMLTSYQAGETYVIYGEPAPELDFNIEWIKQLGGRGRDSVYDSVTDDQGNTYIVGQTNSPEGPPEHDWVGASTLGGFIAKIDAEGNFVWGKQIEDSENNLSGPAQAVTIGNDGQLYVTGTTNSPDFGGPPINPIGGNDLFVSKHDPNGGDEIWVRRFGTTHSNEGVTGIAADTNGNVSVSGHTWGAFDEAGGNLGSRDAFLVSYDTNGDHRWTKQLGTSTLDAGRDVAVDDEGNAYLFADTQGDWAGQIGTAGWDDAVVAKFDSQGNQQWLKQLGTNLKETAKAIEVKGEEIYITGETVGQFGQEQFGGDDVYLAKLNNPTNGESPDIQWVRQLGSPNGPIDDYVEDIAIDQDRVYIGGYTHGGDLAGDNAGLDDAYFAVYDKGGELLATEQIGTWATDKAFGIGTADNDVYLTGWLGAGFGPDPALPGQEPLGDSDAFVIKYSLDAGGTEGDDTLIGGNGADELKGLDGNDTLSGWYGDDIIFGGSGNDTLVGDPGSDIFVLAAGEGTDTITDFTIDEDLIGLSGGLTFADLSFSGNDIIAGSETLATLTGIDTQTLTPENFTLV